MQACRQQRGQLPQSNMQPMLNLVLLGKFHHSTTHRWLICHYDRLRMCEGHWSFVCAINVGSQACIPLLPTLILSPDASVGSVQTQVIFLALSQNFIRHNLHARTAIGWH
jgi:hypothetical protein